jgi:uncharacterized protein
VYDSNLVGGPRYGGSVPVPPLISLVTLGVRDVTAATRFYLDLGFELSPASVAGEVSFFRTGGALLAIWSHDELAEESRVALEPPPGYRGTSLSINLASPAAVDDALRAAVEAGARLTKPAVATDWGGYGGYFADPDGHLWEVAHNPYWPLDDAGLPILP